MPRDGSGTYTLPAGSAAVSGTTISSTKFNALINDLESDANTARPISAGGTGAGSATAARTALGVPSLTGSDTISGNWTISGNPVFSGSPDFSGVANAATIRTDLGLAIGTDVQAQNAALADIAGITGAQGDVLYFNGTNWVALPKGTAGQSLVMNSGATAPEWAAGSSGLTLIESKTISSQATVDFDTFDNTLYKSYKLVLTNVLPATDGTTLRLQFSTDGGSTFDSSTIYDWGVVGTNNTGSDATASQSTGASFIRPAGFRGIGNVASNEIGVSGEIKIYGAASGVYTTIKSELGFVANNGNLENQNGFGQYVSTTEVDAVRLLFDSGNLTSGTVTLYGLS